MLSKKQEYQSPEVIGLVITLRCPIGECIFEIDARTFEEAVEKARDHARAEHNMDEVPPHVVEKIAQAFKPTIW